MKIHHYDSSLVIPYISAKLGRPARDPEGNEKNKRAFDFVTSNRAFARISVATYAEVTRHFRGDEAAQEYMRAFGSPLQLTQLHARRWARLQNRSRLVMGDNDAWNAALAIAENATLVAHDKAFDKRPGLDYLDFMK